MRREELVMEIIGGLDDRFITEAMPSHGSQERAADTRAVVAVTPVEDIGEISKKDRVIYWVTHSLGVAAAAILIIGAAVLLIINWDKIAVREPDRPGVITTVSEPVVTSVDNEHGALYVHADERRNFDDFDVHVTGYEFDRLWCKLYIDVTYKGVEPFTFNIKIEGNEERAQTASRFDKVSEDGDTVSYSVEVFDLKSAKYDTNIIFTKWDGTESFKIPVYFSGKLPTGDIEVNRDMYTYNNKKVTLETIWVCPYMFGFKYKADSIDDIDDLENDFRVILNSGEELKPFVRRSVDDGNGGVFVQALIGDVYADPDIRVNDRIVYFDNIAYFYVNGGIVYSKYSADPFGQITDTSMPRPFPEWHDTDNAQFEFQWKTKAVGAAMDCRGRENYDEWNRRCMSIRTPYRLDDNNNVAGGIKWFGITSEEIDEYFEERNARWQESLEKAEESGNEGAIINCRNEIFSEEEINALKSGNDAEIIALFISDYSIWLTGCNYVISPEWLYYHTAEDYAAIGIEPQMIAAKIPLYEKTFTGTDNGEDLDEKSWKLFRAKLTAYAESAKITDRLSVKTDSMPEPFAPAETNWEARDFFSQWDRKFGDHNSAAEIYLTELSGYETDHGGEQGELYPADTTPYTLDDSANDYNHARIMGLEGDALAELIRKRNETYSKNLGMADYIYSEDEIKLLTSGSRAKIIDRFSSEFSIVVGEYVFSPKWLYYHTIDDYATAGITPEAVQKLLPLYEETFTGEGAAMYPNAWEAFKQKLINYAYRETYSFRLAEITSGFDTELFEKSFYGKWEKDGGSSDDNGIMLTYRDDMFTFENWIQPHGISETDELYVMPYINCGVGECYIIKKDAPNVLYKGWWNLASYGGGSDEKDVFIINTASDKYVIANRFENDRELHPGDEIGVWGLYKLMGNSAQSAIFSQFCLETGFVKTGGFDGSGSFTDKDGVVWEIAGTKSLPPTNIYYIGGDGRRDLKLAVRYYKQTEFDAFIEQGYALPEPAEHYFLLSFETGLVDGAPVCNVTRTKYSLPAQDDAAVMIDNGIEEEASDDVDTIIEDEEN